ncbi:WXG100 family type VII secretion target [Acaricomes phytoseiuli]|uniref:WXG100 family type VII secretion target n=1 Tax=Acaricomes phytoseiuli TaxID=291968 RepID=UPI0003695F2F|nr:WXG100 family type VII secretion target [Acaricomes phytoseiuli]MCW1249232.1 WXG100 family type VII secretion target [Acaricomes phytoseiuli]
MANLNVTYDELEAAGAQLNNGRADLEAKLNELQRQIQALVSSGYVTDSSSKAFEAEYQQFTQGAQQAVSGLEGLAAYLRQAADVLRSTDQQLASQLGR